jgi:TetR/AcrR family transcriptional regulator
MPLYNTSRSPGRPRKTGLSNRERLLDVAASQITASRSTQLGVRELARDAGVTPALLHYYFGDLAGLLDCLLRERGDALLQPLREELQADTPGAGARLSRFVQRWSSLVARQPWLLPCLLRPSAEAEGGAWLAADLRAVTAQAQREGAVRSDLPDHYVAMLLLLLGALPQFCGTGLGSRLSLSADPASAAQLTLLHLSVLQQGIAARAS